MTKVCSYWRALAIDCPSLWRFFNRINDVEKARIFFQRSQNCDLDIWFYYPNQGAAIFFTILFGLIGSGLIYHACHGGSRAFIISVMIGVGMEVGGFACRAAARKDMYSVVGNVDTMVR